MGVKKLVPIATKAAGSQVVAIETGATEGAIIGVNLMLPDGTVVRAEDILNRFIEGSADDLDFVVWKQLQEIPKNIVELAKLTGSGFAYRNQDGTWRLRKVGRQVLNFSYGDASPSVIYTPSVNAVMTLCRIDIDTAFNGAGAALAVGTAASPQLLMPADRNAPSMVAAFETTPDVTVLAGTDLRLTITPGGGASQGAGRIVLDSIPVEGI